ncbi:hypothetical protein RRG08_030202 [Elysia crispata]|uniref:Zinc transporter ZIP1 n=1 Tax=Elysia crispata TaxID=231223 RepID=A0AAE1ASC1_9GAST|nr:hypothetical protein RRG08_030202 [Elysia crispata]
MEVVISKVLTAIILFVLTLVFSFIPYVMVLRGSKSVVSARRRDGVIAYLNCLAGGVFLGTLLMHILPEGSEQFDKYKDNVDLVTEFPLFNLFVVGGFFLVAFVELFVHAQLHHRHPETYSGCDDKHATVHGTVGEAVYPTEDVMTRSNHMMGGGNYGAIPANTDVRRNSPATLSQHLKGQESEAVGILPARSFSRSNSVHHEIQSHHAAGVRAFLLLMALSFHTIFDGLAVGLQTSSSEVWSVFAAITVHKTIIAFCLGLELFQSNVEKPWKAMVWLIFFGLMSPLGISVGIGLTSSGINESAELLASSVLQGVAGGTFLYVTFLEILCMHIGHHSSGNFFYVFFALVGFAIMAGTRLLDHD